MRVSYETHVQVEFNDTTGEMVNVNILLPYDPKGTYHQR